MRQGQAMHRAAEAPRPEMPAMADIEAITEPGRYQDLSPVQGAGGFSRPAGLVRAVLVGRAGAAVPASPQIAYGWRRMLLRAFGARVGAGAIIRPTVRVTYPWKVSIGEHAWIGDDVTLYSLGEIDIGAHSVVSQKSYICAGDHDYQSADFAIRGRPVRIGTQVWVASDVFIAPGVTIADGVVVGARSTVLRSLQKGFVYVRQSRAGRSRRGWSARASTPGRRATPA